MAVPLIAALKAAHAANEGVRRFVPGGWKTVISMLVVVIIVIPTMLVYSAVSSFNMNPEPMVVCGDPNTSSNIGDDHEDGGDEGQGGGDGGGSGGGAGSGIPFPETDSTSIVYPVTGSSATSSYGPRESMYINGMWTLPFHDGTDFGAAGGTPILAMADGVVTMSHYGTGHWEGSMMQIQHRIKGQNYTTAYRHIQGKSIKFKVGDTVKVGQQIASVGREGIATGNHLHFVLARGTYSRKNSMKSAAGTISAKDFLKSNGASAPSGGLTGDDFEEGYDPVKDPGSELCVEGNGDTRLPGDGTAKWNSFQNGKFDEEQLGKVGSIKLYKDAAEAYKQMAEAYKKDTKKELVLKTGYLSFDEQKKLYDEEKQLEKAGKSVFGFARIAEISNANDRNNEASKWLAENASKYGWEQPSVFASGGSSDDPAIWGYVGGGEIENQFPPAGDATVKSNREMAKKIMSEDYPQWNDREYGCLVNLWHKESTWSHTAANPISSARGIAQTMMSIHFGKGWASDAKSQAFLNSPQLQIEWGLNYIKGRYDTPCLAWKHWSVDINPKTGKPYGNY